MLRVRNRRLSTRELSTIIVGRAELSGTGALLQFRSGTRNDPASLVNCATSAMASCSGLKPKGFDAMRTEGKLQGSSPVLIGPAPLTQRNKTDESLRRAYAEIRRHDQSVCVGGADERSVSCDIRRSPRRHGVDRFGTTHWAH